MACLSIYISCLDSNRVICNEWKHFTQLHQLEVWHCVTLNKSLYPGSDIKASSISNAIWQANASYSKCLLATQTLMYLSDRDFHPHCQRDKNSKDPCLSWRETRFSYQTSLGQTSSLKRLAAISQVTRERCFSTVLTSQPRRRKRATYCIRWAPWNFFALARSSSSADAQPAPHAGYRYTSIAKVVDRQEQSAFSLPYATRSR